MKIKTCILLLFLSMDIIYAQNTTISFPQEQQTVVSPTQSAISVKLACRKREQWIYYTRKEWKHLANNERLQNVKIGIIIGSGNNAFMLSLNNNMSTGVCSKGVTYEVAKKKSGNQLPTRKQWQIIKNNRQTIRDALNDFGGEHLCNQNFWCEDGSYFNLGNSTSDDAMYRLATTDINNGFQEVVVNLNLDAKEPDYIGKYSYSNIAVIRHDEKYGFIDKDRKIIVPIKYDEVGCGYDWQNKKSGNDNMNWYYSVLMSVAQNGKWGYVNRGGKVIVPLIYDEVDDCSHTDNTPTWIKKDNLYGCIDTLGNIVIPIKYQSKIKFYNGQPAKVKLNDKWGFINEKNEILVPFMYESTRGFGWKGELAPVSQNNKFGFINKSGSIIIPLQYEFADDFESGLAGIVKNGKVGFVNENGEVVIPCIYDLEYSSDGNGKTLGFGMSFGYGEVAFVMKDGKYGMINKKGENVTSFKFDGVTSAGSDGYFTVILGDEKLYVDKGGNEYETEEERAVKSDSLLAYQGYPYQQFKMGMKSYKLKDYRNAYPWFKKSAEGGDDDGQCCVGYYYYYGYDPIVASSNEAFKWFLKAAEQKNDEACYFLGWMYEHGQGVEKNIEKAIYWYKKSNAQRDSKNRILALEKMLN